MNPMNDTNNAKNQTRKMFTRNPIITSFFEIESRDATWCVNGLEDGEEPARVWAMGKNHAEEIAAALLSHGFTDISVEEV
jgi:hypothetical protein